MNLEAMPRFSSLAVDSCEDDGPVLSPKPTNLVVTLGKTVTTKSETMKKNPITKFTDVLVISNGPKTASCRVGLILYPQRGKSETSEEGKQKETNQWLRKYKQCLHEHTHLK